MAAAETPTGLGSSMDRCLRTPELVARICDEADKESALALALTGKRFLDPGLNSRWRNLTSFEPLVACLPTDLLREMEFEPALDSRMMVRVLLMSNSSHLS